jgi:cell division protein FtsB
MIRVLIGTLLLALLILQYRLWVGEGSLAEAYSLREQITAQKRELKGLKERNQALHAEVVDLKNGLDAIEERARNDLGMIREGEIFYQTVEPDRGAAD